MDYLRMKELCRVLKDNEIRLRNENGMVSQAEELTPEEAIRFIAYAYKKGEEAFMSIPTDVLMKAVKAPDAYAKLAECIGDFEAVAVRLEMVKEVPHKRMYYMGTTGDIRPKRRVI